MSAPQVAYSGLEPTELWRHFAALNATPRPTGHEAAARDYVIGLARSKGAEYLVDGVGNCAVRVPASPGREDASTVVVQAHLDMVCESRPDTPHDFLRDPILPERSGEWIRARGTTLGADNGIGAAAALALLTSPDLSHPALELLFTVEEEVGLVGATGLDPTLISGRRLINLDSEDPRELTVGCAGGGGSTLHLDFDWSESMSASQYYLLVVGGLKGGHSGVQIHEPLANAIKLLVEILDSVAATGVSYRLGQLHGGKAHNAIPRDAQAVVALDPGTGVAARAAVLACEAAIRSRWGASEPGLSITWEAVPAEGPLISATDTAALLALLREIPHGVLAMSAEFPGKVETSTNLALIEAAPSAVRITTSTRSFLPEEVVRVQREITERGRAAGARAEPRAPYPGWKPDPESTLLRQATSVYRQIFGTAPEVQVIHAGLECGVLLAHFPGEKVDAISFGPRIEGAHSPDERVEIRTVTDTWALLTGLLEVA